MTKVGSASLTVNFSPVLTMATATAAYVSKHGVDDMVMLSKISEDAILENLKKRYDSDMIYVRKSGK